MKPTFLKVWKLLQREGFATIRSRRTVYRVEASHIDDKKVIIGYPRRGRVVIHDDCWLENKTCHGTRAGGLYNGPYSITNWYDDNI